MARPKRPETPLAERLVKVIGIYEKDHDLPAALAVGKSALSEYQRGTKIPRGDFFERLHKLTNVNLNWLLTGEGVAFDPEVADVPLSAATQMNMRDSYVKAIVDRLIQVHSKTERPINQELFWWVVTTVHQELVERFDGADASADEMEPILDAFIDKQAKKAGW